MAVSSEYRVNIIISSKDESSAALKKSAFGWTELRSQLSLAKAAFDQVHRTAKAVYDFIGEGAAVIRAQTAITNLAKSYGQSGQEIIAAIQEASDFTIDRMTAMQVANKAMLMGVAKSPEQFAELARTATILGRAMGLDAVTAIDRFTIAAGRKSVKVADDLGLLIDASIANENYAKSHNKLVEELNAAEQSQAFLNAMMEAAEPKVRALEGATADAATQMEQLSAAFKDVKDDLAVIAAEAVAGEKGIDGLTQVIRTLPAAVQAVLDLGEAWTFLGRAARGDMGKMVELADMWPRITQAASDAVSQLEGLVHVEGLGWIDPAIAQGWQDRAAAMNSYALQVSETTIKVSQLKEGWTSYTSQSYLAGDATVYVKQSQWELETAILSTITAMENEKKAAEELTLTQSALQSSLMDATDAQIAQAAISELGALLKEDKISVEDYKTAVTETQLAFGLADEESIKLAAGILDLTTKFGEGEIKAQDFDSALLALKTQTEQVDAVAQGFKTTLDTIPEHKVVTIETVYTSSQGFPRGPVAGGGEGTVNNAPTYNFNQTVNTQATTANVMRDWETARALVE